LWNLDQNYPHLIRIYFKTKYENAGWVHTNFGTTRKILNIGIWFYIISIVCMR